HRRNVESAEHWPCAMICSTTHDTKRSEDVRARINVLAELVEEWSFEVAHWLELTKDHVSLVDGTPAPTANDRYLLFQTLLGTYPDPPPTADEFGAYRERIVHYMEKAIKEAKQHTSWVNPNKEYDGAVARFVEALLDNPEENPFLEAFRPLARRVA